jgi:protein involved in sex pheromone biosynthesis
MEDTITLSEEAIAEIGHEISQEVLNSLRNLTDAEFGDWLQDDLPCLIAQFITASDSSI